jgi:cbb3-type cytochrome c oxidase subunit III
MMRRRPRFSTVALEGAALLVFLALLVPAGVVGWAIGHRHHSATATAASAAVADVTVDPHVAAGAHNFTQFACAKCHGLSGKGDVSPLVPALTSAGKTLTVAQLTQIINHGLGVSADPTRPYMPVWGAVMSKQQVADLVTYVRAGLPSVPFTEAPVVPRNQGTVVAGMALYQAYGCENCHGPNGAGGVPNPSSPDKTIPPLSGAGFRGEFNTDAKIIEFIRSGSVLGKAPIVSMPHWGGIISDVDMQALADYIKTFR